MRKLVHTRWAFTLAALALALGCLVSATVIHASYPEPVIGIDFIGVDSDGAVFSVSNFTARSFSTPSETYISRDGGLYWTLSPQPLDYQTIGRGGNTAATPRGVYSLQPDGIWLTRDIISEPVYSTEFLSDQSNIWLQTIETRRLYSRVITETPYDMVYDESSGNVIVSMGLLGVLVGAPDGEWLPVDVGYYFIPVDFSFSNKLDHLITRHWASFLALSIAVVAAASTISNLRRRDVLWATVATIGGIMVSGALFVILFAGQLHEYQYPVFGGACVLLIGSLAYAALGRSTPTRTRLMVSLALAVCGACLSLASLPLYGYSGRLPPAGYGPPPGIVAGFRNSLSGRFDGAPAILPS